MAINSFDSAPGVPLIQLQWNLSKGVMRRHLTRSHTFPRRHVGCFCNANKDLKKEKATCKLILHKISRHLIHAFKQLPLGKEFFFYHFNILGRLHWMWSLRALWECAVSMSVKPVGPIWKRVQEAKTDESLGTDFSCQLSMPFSPVKSRWYQCVSSSCHSPYCCKPVTLKLCLLAEEREEERKSRSNRERKRAFLLDTMDEQSVSTPWCSWRFSKERRKEPRLSITSEEPTVQLTDNPHGQIWFSPLDLADNLTGLHGRQATTEQIKAVDIELQYMHLNQGGIGPVDW